MAGCFALSIIVAAISPTWRVAHGAEHFYGGKTIQMIVSSGPGVATDIAARLVARYLGKHVPGNPTIVARNMPGGGGLVAANYLYNIAKSDGLTILAVSRANYLEQLAGRIFDVKMKHVTGFQSARETDLGIERGEADCRAATDVVVLRPPWDRWMKDKFITFILQQGPVKSNLVPPVLTVYELAPAEAKPTVDLMSVMLAYTDFERPFAAPPGVAKEPLQILRDSFQRVWRDPEFAAEGKKFTDWDGSWHLTGEQLQKKMDATISQPADVIKRIKEILEES